MHKKHFTTFPEGASAPSCPCLRAPMPFPTEFSLTAPVTFLSLFEAAFPWFCNLCRLSVCLSVTFVRPTQGIEIFGNVSTPFNTLAICWHPVIIIRRSSHGNLSVGGVKDKRVSRPSWPIERYIWETVQDRS